jgi:hypothetical protein
MVMRVVIRQPWVPKFFLEVTMTDTVATVKDKIREREGLPLGVRHFLFNGDGLELQEDRTLADYNVDDGNTLMYTAHSSRAPPSSEDVHAADLAFDAANVASGTSRDRSRSPRRRADGR